MCDLISITSLALSAAGSAMQYQQQKDYAKQQTRAIQADVAQQMAATQLQQVQANTQASDQISERAKRARAEAARLRVISGEYGGGLSADRLEAQALGDSAADIATIQQNSRNASAQLHQEALGLRSRGQSQINSLERPSGLGLGLNLASQTLGAYNGYRRQRVVSKASDLNL